VVVNNAAASALAINTFAEAQVLESGRGELESEIGGSFRIPTSCAGARLREVGTTNRTRIADYRDALGPETGLVLKVHPSNFPHRRLHGAPRAASSPRLAPEAGVPAWSRIWGAGSPPARRPGRDDGGGGAARGAVDVGTSAATRLLGGPQAGLVVGETTLGADAQNRLYRALRVDKMTLPLDAVLVIHESRTRGRWTHPAHALASVDEGARARRHSPRAWAPRHRP
jgi:L-seryl-tRNA(Ser) seleniumtransferase